jgi:hypothetical protein
MICFVPVGTTALPSDGPEASPATDEGPPHMAMGMLTTFTVD